MSILIIILCGFAWAIGGEKYFGKGKRGFLLMIPFAIHALIHGLSWQYYIVQGALLYVFYQILRYDDGIQLVWSVPTTPSRKIVGYTVLALNGLCISGNVVFYYCYIGQYIMAIISAIVISLWFVLWCWISNVLKLCLDSCIIYKQVKIWCPADSWWFAEFGIGLGVGIMLIP